MKTSMILVPLAVVAAGSGCSTLLPRHPNSMVTQGEVVSVRYYRATDGKLEGEVTDLQADFTAAVDSGQAQIAAEAVALAALAKGAELLVDWTKGQLSEESSKYESSFSQRVGLVDFTEKAGTGMTIYPGVVEVKRTVTEGGKELDAFRYAVAIVPKTGKPAFYMIPIYYKTSKSRAKVLDLNNDANWLTQIPFLYGLALEAENEIETTIALEFQGMTVRETGKEEKVVSGNSTVTTTYKERTARQVLLGSFEQKFGGYHIGKNRTMRLRPGENKPDEVKMPFTMSDWILVPDEDWGTTVRVVVHERDTSNTKNIVERVNNAIEKDDILKAISEGVKK
ncbi:MAG: hypothetical protein SF028_12785 [Candidatus Sumerlaeia bacterium]|nr:hypothetical protein [Candidatus Sumerlaeia bacterium]